MDVYNKTIVINALFIKTGGPLIMLKRYLEDLDNKRAKSIILITTVDINYDCRNIKKILLKDFKKYSFFSIIFYLSFKINQILNEINYDFIISFDYSARVKRIEKIQYLYCHNAIFLLSNLEIIKLLIYDTKYFYYKFIYSFISTYFLVDQKYIIVQQSELANHYKNNGFKVIIQPPSLIISNYNYDPSIFNLAEELKLKSYSKEFLYPTSCKPHKNILMIIKAFTNKCNEDKNLNITICNDNSRYFNKIQELIKGRSNIRLIGSLSHNKLLNFMKYSQPIIIFPSLIESWGLPIEEAKNLNLNILVLNRNYARETLMDYKNVVYVDNTVDDWVKAVEEIYI
jgi:glycosyltransferase involved in cell wall biosynthesis